MQMARIALPFVAPERKLYLFLRPLKPVGDVSYGCWGGVRRKPDRG